MNNLLILFSISIMLIGCKINNVRELKYVDLSNRDTMIIKLSNNEYNGFKTIKEKYEVPIKARGGQNISVVKLNWEDEFYLSKSSLFRLFKSKGILMLPSEKSTLFVHMSDILWLPNWMFTENTDTIIAFSDRGFIQRGFNEIHEELIKYQIWFDDKEFSKEYNDTLITIGYRSLLPEEQTEFYTFDSHHYIVKYRYKDYYNDCNFLLINEDYKKLIELNFQWRLEEKKNK